MKSVFVVLQEYMTKASSAEKGIIQYVLDFPENAADATIKQLSRQTYSSQATIVRLCSKLGYKGYREFKRTLFGELEVIRKAIRYDSSEISKADSLEEIASKVTMMNMKSIEDMLRLIDYDSLAECVRLIDQADTIGLFGVGAGLVVARDAYIKMLRLNKPCVFNDDWHNQRLQAQNLGREDLAIVFSYSGQTKEVLECTRILKKNQCPVIAVTQNDSSPISQLASQKIYIPSNEQMLRSGAMASRMAQMNAVDILYIAYAYRRYDSFKQRLAETYIQK